MRQQSAGMVLSRHAPAWRRRGGTLAPIAALIPPFSRPAEDAKSPLAATSRHKKIGEKTHEPIRHHLHKSEQRQERTRDLDNPRDLVAADSVPGGGVFLFLSRT